MEQDKSILKVRKPVSVWNREIKFDPKGLFSALGDAALNLMDGERVEAGKKVFDALLAGELKTGTVEALAYVLILKSLISATADLVRDAIQHLDVSDPEELIALEDELTEEFEKAEVDIKESFASDPGRMPIVEVMRGLLVKWFIGQGLPQARAETAASSLPFYFADALDKEWRWNSDTYRPLEKLLSSPFSPAATGARAWLSHKTELNRKLHEPLFGQETFNITHVYVPLCAYYEGLYKKDYAQRTIRSRLLTEFAQLFAKTKETSNEELQGLHPKFLGGPPKDFVYSHQVVLMDQSKNVVDLEDVIEKWLEGQDPEDGLRVLAGGPGSGKSTFARMLAARSKIPTLFIPLHEFRFTGHLEDEVDEYLTRYGGFSGEKIIRRDARPFLIVFDGLDELPFSDQEAMENAKNFIREVNRVLNAVNRKERVLSVLVTGRSVVIDSSWSELRKREQVLHLLPYQVPENERREYSDPQSLLKKDLRDNWWRLYGQATNQPYSKGLPKELRDKGKRMDDLTRQPLLNYLVALSLERGKISFRDKVNMALLYNDLLRHVYDGLHNALRRKPHESTLKLDELARREGEMVRGLTFNDYLAVLEESAVAVWHAGESRIVPFQAIADRCRECGLDKDLDLFRKGVEAGLARILTAFYTRRHGGAGRGQDAVEFTHKSFHEFLSAQRMFEELQAIEQQMTLRNSNRRLGWDEDEALEKWAILCGPAELGQERHQFLTEVIRLKDEQKAQVYQNRAARLFSYLLSHGLPMQKIEGLTFKEMSLHAARAETALLAVASACAFTTKKLTDIDWPEKDAFKLWLHRTQGSPITWHNFLYYLDLSSQDMASCNLNQAILVWANLSKASLEGTNLERALLVSTNLTGANLRGANLRDTLLWDANLTEANLEAANLEGAFLAGANLEGANLEEANLKGTYLGEAEFEGAYLEGANLLHTMKFQNAINLEKINSLFGAKLDPEDEEFIRQNHPHLLEPPKED